MRFVFFLSYCLVQRVFFFALLVVTCTSYAKVKNIYFQIVKFILRQCSGCRGQKQTVLAEACGKIFRGVFGAVWDRVFYFVILRGYNAVFSV